MGQDEKVKRRERVDISGGSVGWGGGGGGSQYGQIGDKKNPPVFWHVIKPVKGCKKRRKGKIPEKKAGIGGVVQGR